MREEQVGKPLHHRFLLALVFIALSVLSACDGASEGTPPVDCELNPCNPSCYEGCSLACDPCSDACVAEGLAPSSCNPSSSCDELCDPCAPDCEPCGAACTASLAGPELPEPRCEAVALNEPGEAPRRWQIDYEVPEGIPSWLLSVFTDDLHALLAVRLSLPDASEIELDAYDSFTLHQQGVSPAMISLLMPSAPRYLPQLQQGLHQLIVESESDASPCWTLTPQLQVQAELPFRLLVRIIGVGPALGDVTALQENALLREALLGTQQYYANAGIGLYVHEWLVLEDALRDAHGEILSFEGVQALLRSLPEPAGDGADAALAVNIAVIDRFAGEYALQGLTGGLPGPVSLHGTSASGVVVSSALLTRPRGVELIGALTAHELAHYLGLRHTTSFPFAGEDPLEDTPTCSEATYRSDPFACPDAENMMFPVLSVNHENKWSPQQKQLLHWHPSVTQRTE